MSWKLISSIYFIQLVIGLFIGGQLYRLIDDKLGHTGAMKRFQEGWDYSGVQDFLFYFSRELDDIKFQLFLLIVIYVISMAILSGGIWSCINKKRTSFGTFFLGVKKDGFKFLLISILSLVIMIIWSLILWLPFITKVMVWLEYWADERYVAFLGFGILILWSLGLTVLFSWTYAVRACVITQGANLISSMGIAIKTIGSKFWQVIPVVAFLSILSLFLLYLSPALDALIGMTSSGLIVLSIVIQQLVVWIKIVLRVGLISSFLSIIRA